MLRDNLAGLIEPMLSGAGAYPLALRTNRKQSSDDRPPCLENPRPAGAESTLTENGASPFHAEPGHEEIAFADVRVDKCFSCEGMWLDKGEFETLQTKEPGFMGRMLRAFR
jgi:hypothetical protein